jgi:hypothetical protein
VHELVLVSVFVAVSVTVSVFVAVAVLVSVQTPVVGGIRYRRSRRNDEL